MGRCPSRREESSWHQGSEGRCREASRHPRKRRGYTTLDVPDKFAQRVQQLLLDPQAAEAAAQEEEVQEEETKGEEIQEDEV